MSVARAAARRREVDDREQAEEKASLVRPNRLSAEMDNENKGKDHRQCREIR